MKNTITAVLAIVAALGAWQANAMVRYEDKYPKRIREIRITGFIDYAPFGWTQRPESPMRGKFSTVYQPMLDTFKEENNLKLIYNLTKRNYDDLVQEVRTGKIDMILGAYHDTELYKGLELVYPSLINNPVTIITLPKRVKDVQNISDLKKLKGVRISREYYSDFVELKLKEYNLETVDTPYELFERLFTQKADYILISQYYGLIEAIKLGLREQISIARQMIWKMPVFIGVSKVSQHRKLIIQKLTHYSEKPEHRKMIEQSLLNLVTQFEKDYAGVVPPTFGLENQTTTPIQESADKKESDKNTPKETDKP